MKVSSDRHEVIFRNDYNGKTYYKLKLVKKDEQGNWLNGYINCRFKKDVVLEDKTHVEIKDAWLDFYVKDKNTVPFIFINDFTIADVKKDPFIEMGEQIESDYPF